MFQLDLALTDQKQQIGGRHLFGIGFGVNGDSLGPAAIQLQGDARARFVQCRFPLLIVEANADAGRSFFFGWSHRPGRGPA